MRKEIADDGMMEEERISDFGFDKLSDAYYKGDARFDVQHMKRRHPE